MGLKQKSLSGFIWTAAGLLGNGAVSFLVTMVLARILLPYHFALVELLFIFLTISNVIVDSGFSQAIIRDDNPTETDLSSVFYFNLGLSLTLYTILFFGSPYISDYFEAPELTLLARVVFLVVIFNAFSIIQNATLNRDLNFVAVNKASVIGSFLAGGIAVAMALTGFGIWALVANMTLLPFFRSVLLWYSSKWRPKWMFSFRSVKRYFAFGGFLMVQGIIDAISTNLVSLLIGKVYTKNDLGYFSQGRKFDGYLVRPFNAIVEKVTYPILSKIKNEDERLKQGYRLIIGTVMFVFLPVMFLAIGASENLIVSFFGPKWEQAGLYLRIATIGSLFYPLQRVCTNIVKIKGRTRIMLRFAFIKHGLRIGLLLAFMNAGVLALAIVFAVTSTIGSLLFIVLGMNLLGFKAKELIQDIGKSLISSFIGVLLVIAIGYIMKGYTPILVLTIQAVGMGIIVLTTSKIMKNKYMNEALSMIKPIFSKFIQR